MNDKKVLILETHAKSTISVIDSCVAMGLYVIAGSYKKYCCGMFCRGIKERLIYPHPIQSPEKTLDFLLDYLRRHEISAVIPAGGPMTDLLCRHQEKFAGYTHFLLPDYQSFRQGLDKILTLKAAERIGIPIPRTWYPEETSLEQAVQQIDTFPVLIKPAVSSGSRGIVFCNSKDEIKDSYKKIVQQYGASFLQDFVPPGGKQYKVDAVMDKQQNMYAGVVYSKLRYYPVDGGSSVLNKTEYRSDILDAAVKMMKELKWVGLCDFDFITDPRDGIVKLMEINPRFPESYRATVAAGVDMTKIIYQLAIGCPAQKQLDYKENQYCRFLFGDIMWFLKTKESRFRTKPSFFRFWGKDMYYQLFRKNDIGPVLGYILENMEMLWNRKLRQERLR